MSTLRADLLAWYQANHRDLPWRKTRDPYSVWVSEIMLQQTTVAAVIPYFERWMARFPTVSALASAELDEALAIWQGLGYYRRCRSLHAGAVRLDSEGIPETVEGWLSVPGVGRYTAGAITSICFGAAAPAVDGNVERVYARLNADSSERPARVNAAWDWAEQLAPGPDPGDWTQALIELGAVVCSPKAPSCEVCPVHEQCLSRQKGLADSIPALNPATKWKDVEHDVWLPICGQSVGLRPIPDGEWWAGMMGLPRGDQWSPPQTLDVIGRIKHVVTNHRITSTIHLAELDERDPELTWHELAELDEVPMPAPHRRALQLYESSIGSQAIGSTGCPASSRK